MKSFLYLPLCLSSFSYLLNSKLRINSFHHILKWDVVWVYCNVSYWNIFFLDPRNKAHKFLSLISFRFFFEAFFFGNIALLFLLYKKFRTQKLIVYKLFLKIVNPSGINHLNFCFDWFVKWKPYKHIRKYICCAISYKFFWFIFKSL